MATKKVQFEFNPFKNVKIPQNKRAAALKEVKSFVLEQVLEHVGEGRSPVKGGKWKRSLTKSYKAVKRTQSSVGFANLELSGDMLDALKVVQPRGTNKIKLSVKGVKQNAKADGNNRGSYGGSPDSRKAREFVPQKSKKQTFNNDIWNGIDEIVQDHGEDD